MQGKFLKSKIDVLVLAIESFLNNLVVCMMRLTKEVNVSRNRIAGAYIK